MTRTSTAYVGLGSNLGDRAAAIDAAIEMLEATPGLRISKTSSVRETIPAGKLRQPKFLNAVAEVKTTLTPISLLRRLQQIEARLGRVRHEHWGPRIIDLDLLLHSGRTVTSPELTLPHPRIAERSFVLEPLAELCPNAMVPGTGRTVAQLLEALTERPAR